MKSWFWRNNLLFAIGRMEVKELVDFGVFDGTFMVVVVEILCVCLDVFIVFMLREMSVSYWFKKNEFLPICIVVVIKTTHKTIFLRLH